MGVTKGELAQKALRRLGVNTRTSDATSNELQDTIDTLDDFMQAMAARGYQLGYNFTSADPQTDSLLPAWAIQGVTASLAREMCTYFGQAETPELSKAIFAGWLTIDQRTTQTPKTQNPRGFPRGSGNSCTVYGSTRFYEPERVVGSDGQFVEANGDTVTTN